MKPSKIGANRVSGGVGSRNIVEVGNRVGVRAKAANLRGVSQIGQSLGNHVTESGKKGQPVEGLYGAKRPPGSPGGVVLGNAKALDVGKGGCGTGRTLYGQSGVQGVHGPVNPGATRPGADKPLFPGWK
jgi:hypothetical protein